MSKILGIDSKICTNSSMDEALCILAVISSFSAMDIFGDSGDSIKIFLILLKLYTCILAFL